MRVEGDIHRLTAAGSKSSCQREARTGPIKSGGRERPNEIESWIPTRYWLGGVK